MVMMVDWGQKATRTTGVEVLVGSKLVGSKDKATGRRRGDWKIEFRRKGGAEIHGAIPPTLCCDNEWTKPAT